jgi:hypothetical protein
MTILRYSLAFPSGSLILAAGAKRATVDEEPNGRRRMR